MTISQPKDAYLKHLQKLTALWENLYETPSFSDMKYYELYERSKNVIDHLCADAKDFYKQLGKKPSKTNIERFIAKLRATQLDLNDGFLRLEYRIQEKIAIDLMQQAQELLTEGKTGTHEHIPAAVLAGAVLEHFLRTLCGRQSPPISLSLDNGNLKTLARLVTDLEGVGIYNAVEKKQLKVWVEIRNAAAHGHFDQFTQEQVVNMIQGIKHFIEDHG